MTKKSAKTGRKYYRRKGLSNIKGQKHVTDYLEVEIRAYHSSKDHNRSFGPAMLSGPPGVGKTMVAKEIHGELKNKRLIEVNGEALNSKKELYSTLIDMQNSGTLLIDECHAMNRRAQHILLTSISEKKLFVPSNISSVPACVIDLPDFAMIFATTDEYQIQAPLRNRMRIYCRFDYYSVEDLVEIVHQRADELNAAYESEEVLHIIAQRAKRTPRLALDKNLSTCLSVSRSNGHKMITLDDVHKAFGHLQIDELGLDRLDRSYLELLYDSCPSTVGVLSSRLSMPSLTIQKVVEPYLLREGFINKGKSSVRIITQKGRNHIETTSFKPVSGG